MSRPLLRAEILAAATKLNGLDRSPGCRKPNLFIVGSMKSGTTYLWSLLALHPSIFMCDPKEPSYFVQPAELQAIWPWAWEHNSWRSEQDYLELFQLADTATILGEASVHYTYLPFASGVAERLYRFNPDARLIYVIRDPIERTISHYWHRVRWLCEHRSLSSAIENDPQYRDVSHYAMQLAPYLRLFKRDQIKILTFEALVTDTNASIASILRWLNLDCSTKNLSLPPVNATPDIIKQRRLVHGRHENRRIQSLMDHAPVLLRRIAARMATREINRQSVDTSKVVQYLRPIQQKQTEALMRLLGRDFAEWTTLYQA